MILYWRIKEAGKWTYRKVDLSDVQERISIKEAIDRAVE